MENHPAQRPSDGIERPSQPPAGGPPEVHGGNERPAAPALWNPNAAALWSLLLSPLFGSLLLRANFRALGDRRGVVHATRWAWLTIGLMIVPQFLPESVGEGPVRALFSLSLLLVWYYTLARPHIQSVEIRFGTSYPHRRWSLPFGIVALSIIGLFLVTFLITVLQEKLGLRSASSTSPVDEFQDERKRSSIAFGPVQPADVPILLERLGHTNQEVAYTSAFLLKRLGGPAVASLIKGLADASAERRQWSACALGMIGLAASNAAPALLPLCNDLSKDVRTAAAYAIGRIEPEGGPTRSQLVLEASDFGDAPKIFAFVEHENTPGSPICMMRSAGAFWFKDSEMGAGSSSEKDTFYSSSQTFLDMIVRPAAQRTAIRSSGGAKEISGWIEALGDESEGPKTATLLCQMGARALPALRAALESPERQTRERAAFVLGCLGPQAKDAIPDLARMLEAEPPDENGHCRTCGAAAFALESIGPAAVGPLLRLVRSDHEMASRYAAVALGKSATPERVEALVQVLSDSREHVLVSAALALGRMAAGAQPAVALLRERLSRPDPTAALTVAVALERISGTGEGLPVLSKTLSHEDPEIRRAAASAIRALWESPGNQTKAENFAADGPSKRAVEESKLVAALLSSRDSSPAVRSEVMQCLGALPSHGEPELRALAKGLADDDRAVQNHAALALARHGAAGLSHFALALRHTNSAARRWAVFGLGHVMEDQAQSEAVRLLIEALSDQDSGNRGAAAEALSQVTKRTAYANGVRLPSPARAAVPALTRRLDDPNIEVRLQAALTLAELDATTPQSQRIIADAAQVPSLPRETRDRISAALRQGTPKR